MSAFKTYFYSLKDDDGIYTAQYLGDFLAKTHLLDIYGMKILAIWRPERTIYEDPVRIEVPKVPKKKRRWARSR